MIYFFFVFSSLNTFSNLQQVAHCFEQLYNTEASFHPFGYIPFSGRDVEQHCIK